MPRLSTVLSPVRHALAARPRARALTCALPCLLAVACSSVPPGRPTEGNASLPAATATAATAPPAAADADTQALRAEFLQALQQARQIAPAPADSRVLRDYVLYDYLLAARLQHALQLSPDPALDGRIDAFLRTHPGAPLTRDLRHDWLVSLAARGRWDWFLPRAVNLGDPLLVCQRLIGRLATGDAASAAQARLLADALSVWSQPVQQPPECDGIFDWLQRQSALTPARVEARARAALAAGNVPLALQLAAALPSGQSAPLLLWARLLQAPAATLQTLAGQPTTAVEPQALEAGFHRLALRDSAAAALLLPALQARADMTSLLQGQLQRDAALGLAYDHSSAALALFATLPEPLADERVQQWRVRAALWNEDWRQALSWLSAMPVALAMQPRWQYWRARATQAVQGPDAATPLYAAIAGTRDYYGYLAADRLHRGYDLQYQPTPDDLGTQVTLASTPALRRAHELLACGLYDAAVAEWADAVAGSPPPVKVQAAHLADRWGWYAQSIATLAAAGVWDDVRLRYPRPYGPLVAAAGERTGIAPDWILAVMRQESLFRSDAVSRADARGLMQLQPATALAVAQRWQLPPDAAGLFDPATAVTLGAAHLRELLDRFQGQLAPALATYNAGTAPLTRWLPPAAMDADVWIENIPYDETRGYVQHIVEHIVAYAFTRAADPPQLAIVLPPVGPATAYPYPGPYPGPR